MRIFEHGYAIHHKISKEYLSSISEANQRALSNNKRGAQKDGAQRFWRKVVKATKGVVESTIKPEKRLWNIPANLEVGPENVRNNPGMGFDPNTVPHQQGRRLTMRSEQLRRLLEIFQEEADYAPSDEQWDEMATALKIANAAHNELIDSGLSLPLEEQWVPSQVGTSFTRRTL